MASPFRVILWICGAASNARNANYVHCILCWCNNIIATRRIMQNWPVNSTNQPMNIRPAQRWSQDAGIATACVLVSRHAQLIEENGMARVITTTSTRFVQSTDVHGVAKSFWGPFLATPANNLWTLAPSCNQNSEGLSAMQTKHIGKRVSEHTVALANFSGPKPSQNNVYIWSLVAAGLRRCSGGKLWRFDAKCMTSQSKKKWEMHAESRPVWRQ